MSDSSLVSGDSFSKSEKKNMGTFQKHIIFSYLIFLEMQDFDIFDTTEPKPNNYCCFLFLEFWPTFTSERV